MFWVIAVLKGEPLLQPEVVYILEQAFFKDFTVVGSTHLCFKTSCHAMSSAAGSELFTPIESTPRINTTKLINHNCCDWSTPMPASWP